MCVPRMAMGTAMTLALVLGGVVAVAAQSDEAMPDPAAIVSSTGETDCVKVDPGDASIEPGGILRERDVVLECTILADDPRYSGEATVTWNEDCYLTTDRSVHCIYWGTDVFSSADGGWDCDWTGTPDPKGKDYMLALSTCAGTDGYEGLAYVGHRIVPIGEDAPDFVDGVEHRGLIYEGEPPR